MALGEAGRASVARLMTDSCTITRDPLGLTDAVLDKETGQLTANSANDRALYSGSCYIARDNREALNRIVGGETLSGTEYVIGIPWDAPLVPTGALVSITAAADPYLVGRQLKVTDISGGTVLVWRLLHGRMQEADRGDH